MRDCDKMTVRWRKRFNCKVDKGVRVELLKETAEEKKKEIESRSEVGKRVDSSFRAKFIFIPTLEPEPRAWISKVASWRLKENWGPRKSPKEASQVYICICMYVCAHIKYLYKTEYNARVYMERQTRERERRQGKRERERKRNLTPGPVVRSVWKDMCQLEPPHIEGVISTG